jgi:hypothetical protein
MKDPNCSFCNPRKIDWTEDGFYGFSCPECQGNTAFIVSSQHRGTLNEKEKLLVEQLAKKHYPNLKITWMSEKRTAMSHFYDFLKPNN